MKKILFVIPDLGLGGTNSSLEALYNTIKDLYCIKVFAISHQTRYRTFGFDDNLMPQCRALSLLYTDFSKQSGMNRVLSFLIKSLYSFMRWFGVDIKRLISRFQIRKIESTNYFDTIVAYQEGYATEFVSFFQNPRRIAWIHCNYDKWMPIDNSEELLYSQFSHIVCVSDYTASVFSNRYPSLKDRTVGIINFVETERVFKMGQCDVDDDRFQKKGFTILSAGRFHAVKRFSAIPAIADSLRKKEVCFHWYVIGDANDAVEISNFLENVSKYELAEYVKWLGGKSNPYPYFREADLYVCTSESEACPMVFIEAKLFGTPIVTTNFPSANEFIKDKVNGRIVPLEGVADAIYCLIVDSGVYNSYLGCIKQTPIDNCKQIDEVRRIL